MVGERNEDGFPALTLESEALGGIEAIFIPEAGMVCCSLRHRGEELLGQRGGLPKYVESGSTMGIPFLHPWANRLGRTRFEVAGREVNLDLEDLPLKRDAAGLPMHGLLSAARGWKVDRHGEAEGGGVLAASFDFAAYPRLLAAFPFPHRVEIEATLRAAVLTITTTVRATGDGSVPISFGFHPYLRLPGVARGEWELEAPVVERLELDRRSLPTGRREPAQIEPGPLGSRLFDDAFLAPPGGEPFALSGGGRRLELRMGPGYRFAQIYTPADTDAVAFEPMTAPTNALICGGPDLPLIEPGRSFAATFSITLR
ncbi:MAG TPA: aldose 1-epimerase [Solirubrobacterales bacterium]|jgi:galactose mutarotase-like enzyme|nr:aldose 1-epimerase [Solirubrobacterales bacterium]